MCGGGAHNVFKVGGRASFEYFEGNSQSDHFSIMQEANPTSFTGVVPNNGNNVHAVAGAPGGAVAPTSISPELYSSPSLPDISLGRAHGPLGAPTPMNTVSLHLFIYIEFFFKYKPYL